MFLFFVGEGREGGGLVHIYNFAYFFILICLDLFYYFIDLQTREMLESFYFI